MASNEFKICSYFQQSKKWRSSWLRFNAAVSKLYVATHSTNGVKPCYYKKLQKHGFLFHFSRKLNMPWTWNNISSCTCFDYGGHVGLQLTIRTEKIADLRVRNPTSGIPSCNLRRPTNCSVNLALNRVTSSSVPELYWNYNKLHTSR
jgi:hypothetical protein